MKKTLLQLTQDVLESISGDEITSIEDTIESSQVAGLVKAAYFDLISKIDLEEHFNLFNLTSTSTLTPVVLERPDNIESLLWFAYNKRTSPFDGESAVGELPVGDSRDLTDNKDRFELVKYLDKGEFLDLINSFDQDDVSTSSFTLNRDGYSNTFYYQTNKSPTYWTSFDDKYIICDSLDSYVDSFLRTNKTNCYGKILPTWTHSDSFLPDLDAQQFNLLFNEAKAMAWAELRQTTNARAERNVRNHLIQIERDKQSLPSKDVTWKNKLPNYGRRF